MENSDDGCDRRGKHRRLVILPIEESLRVRERKVGTGRIAIKRIQRARGDCRRAVVQGGTQGPTGADQQARRQADFIREIDGTTIIQVFERIAVVQKQLILREELHITKVRSQIHKPRPVKLRGEAVEVKSFRSSE